MFVVSYLTDDETKLYRVDAEFAETNAHLLQKLSNDPQSKKQESRGGGEKGTPSDVQPALSLVSHSIATPCLRSDFSINSSGMQFVIKLAKICIRVSKHVSQSEVVRSFFDTTCLRVPDTNS